MLASKYVPLLIGIPCAYNYVFQKIPATRWVIGKKRFIKFFIVMGRRVSDFQSHDSVT